MQAQVQLHLKCNPRRTGHPGAPPMTGCTSINNYKVHFDFVKELESCTPHLVSLLEGTHHAFQTSTSIFLIEKQHFMLLFDCTTEILNMFCALFGSFPHFFSFLFSSLPLSPSSSPSFFLLFPFSFLFFSALEKSAFSTCLLKAYRCLRRMESRLRHYSF